LSQPFIDEISRVEKQANGSTKGSSEPGIESTVCNPTHREFRSGKKDDKVTLRSHGVFLMTVDVFPGRVAVSGTLSEGLFGVQMREESLLKHSLSPQKRDNVLQIESSDS
jgi:hypothetical protein